MLVCGKWSDLVLYEIVTLDVCHRDKILADGCLVYWVHLYLLQVNRYANGLILPCNIETNRTSVDMHLNCCISFCSRND